VFLVFSDLLLPLLPCSSLPRKFLSFYLRHENSVRPPKPILKRRRMRLCSKRRTASTFSSLPGRPSSFLPALELFSPLPASLHKENSQAFLEKCVRRCLLCSFSFMCLHGYRMLAWHRSGSSLASFLQNAERKERSGIQRRGEARDEVKHRREDKSKRKCGEMIRCCETRRGLAMHTSILFFFFRSVRRKR